MEENLSKLTAIAASMVKDQFRKRQAAIVARTPNSRDQDNVLDVFPRA